MSKKQIILSQCDSQYSSYSDFIFPYLDQIGLDNYECYNLYYCPYNTGTNYKDLSKINYQSDLIMWVIEDTLSESMRDYNWYSDKKPEGLLYLERICRMYPKKKFILMTEQYKMNDLCTANNLKFVDLTPYCFRFDRSKHNYNICLKIFYEGSGFVIRQDGLDGAPGELDLYVLVHLNGDYPLLFIH